MTPVMNNRAWNAHGFTHSTDKETNTVNCRTHGNDRSYSLVLSDEGFLRICSTCASQHFADAVEAKKAEKENQPTLVLCSEATCMEHTDLATCCVWCKLPHCPVHMPDRLTCKTCEEDQKFELHERLTR